MPPLAELSPGTGVERSGGLHGLDWLVIVAYFAVLLIMGWKHSRRQSNERDFFIAASRPLHPVLVGISMYAAILSTISYLGKPGEMINKGPILLVGQLLALPISFYLVTYKLIPHIMRLRVTSGYELLEAKLGMSVRLLGSGLFIGLRVLWLGLLTYTASVAIEVMLGFGEKGILPISILLGASTIGYASMGGIRSVVIADVFQVSLLFLGAVLTIALITFRYCGLSWIPTHWSPSWDHQPIFSIDPHVRLTLVGSVLGWLCFQIGTASSDQTSLQRFMATKDVCAARRSYLTGVTSTVVATVLLAVLGFALLGFYTQYPSALGPGMTIKASADKLFPYFISHYLPTGFAGLAVTAVIAAAMECIAAGINSISAVAMSDFVDRIQPPPPAEARVRISRRLTVAVGGGVVLLSLLMKHVPGNFMEMTNKTNNLAAMPIFGLFFLAFFVPSATPLAAWLGAAAGLLAGVLIGFWDVLTGRAGISFHLVSPGSIALDLAVSYALCLWGPRRGAPATRTVGWVGGGTLAAASAALIVWGRSR